MENLKEIELNSNYFDPDGGIKDDRNPIIFLHAMLCSKETWVDIPQTVADGTGRRVYAYDARNHGESAHTDESNFKFNVHDLFSLLNEVKSVKDGMEVSPEQVILVGHDMGGMTAISAALKEPNKFEKVIIVEMYTKKVPDFLIDCAKIFMTKWTDCVRKLSKDTQLDDVTRISVDNLYKELKGEMKENNEKLSYQKAKFLYKKTEEGYDVVYSTENIAQALEELKNQKDNMGKYDKPAYFFYGEKSHYNIGKEEDAINEHFPRAKFVKFAAGSHFFIADDPDKFAGELIKSINAVS